MQWWNVLDWVDMKTVRVVATSGFEPFLALGIAQMIAPDTPAPEPALTTQVVNGVTTVVVDQTVLKTLGLGGLKLF